MAGFIADDLVPILNRITRAIDFALYVDSTSLLKY